jgi:hypothetical protein
MGFARLGDLCGRGDDDLLRAAELSAGGGSRRLSRQHPFALSEGSAPAVQFLFQRRAAGVQGGDSTINHRELRNRRFVPQPPRRCARDAFADHRLDLRKGEPAFLRLANESQAAHRGGIVSASSADSGGWLKQTIALIKTERRGTQTEALCELADCHEKALYMNYGSNASVPDMKPFILIPALLLTLPLAFVACATAADKKTAETPLPTSCTLLAMSPTERAAHLERLKLLSRASSAIATTREGFTFNVNLQTMPLSDLQTWAQAEQKCCSFLKIDSQVIEGGKRATVRVVCPEDSKKEVMQTFGLNSRR